MAYIRKQGQSVEIPGYDTGAAVLGTGQQTGVAKPTTAAQPGGWTNIQDYLNANKGDTTNIDTAKQRTAESIQQGAAEVGKQRESVSPIPEPTAYSKDDLSNILKSDDYGNVHEGLTQQSALDQYRLLPDVNTEITGYAPLEQNIKTATELDPTNFQNIMQFVGSLAPNNPNYTKGARAFDAMLLQGSPEFRQNFVPQVQEQYKNLYLDPLEAARAGVTAQREAGQEAIGQAAQDWRSGVGQYLGAEQEAIDAIMAQQQAQEAQASQPIGFDQWLKLYSDWQATQPPNLTGETIAPLTSIPGFNYLNYMKRVGNTAPTAGTAAYQYGGEKVADYNALANLMNQVYGENRNQLTPSGAYNPGTWQLANVGV